MKFSLNSIKAFVLLLLLSMAMPLFAQQKKHTISGYVREKGSKESLIGVIIYAPKYKAGTTTNAYGFFSLTLPADSVDIQVSFVGYTSFAAKLDLNTNITLEIELEPGVNLKEVVITAQQEKVSQVNKMSTVDIPIKQIKTIPALLGEKDVIKVLQLMPGVQKGSEGSSGLYVRGGGADQNLIILDDATVYNASHLFGFFSLFNGDAIKSIELTKGGFPARYGGRLSSVLDINMKDGNKTKYSGEAGIGIISSRLTLEGPIVKNKASFLVSGRRTYIDVLMQPFLRKSMRGNGYYFYDLTAKINYDLGKKDKVYLSGYFGRDQFYSKFKDYYGKIEAGLFWENATATARWNHLFNSKLFSNTSLIFSNYRFNIYESYEMTDGGKFKLDYLSGIRDYSLKYDLEYHPNPNHVIRSGFLSSYHYFTPSAIVLKDNIDNFNYDRESHIEAVESGIYVEDDIKITQKFKSNIGIRVSHFINKSKNYFNPEPRLSISYMLKEDLALKASYAMMSQYVHLLSNTGIGLPTDLWLPSTDRTGPQKSQQLSIGGAKDFLEKNFAVTLEGYYKRSDHVLAYKEGTSFLVIQDPSIEGNYNWEDNITSGKGWSYGAEILVQRKTGKLSGWVGYTLSWTQLQFDELNFGKKYYARYDRRHDISIVSIYELNDRITISGTWVYGTGNAITMPLASYNALPHKPGQPPGNQNQYNPYGNYFPGTQVSEYGGKNSFRMAPYHRLDLGVQFHKQRKKYEQIIEVSVYNVYNRKNPFFYYIGTEGNSNEKVLKQISIFPIIPSISYSIKF
jgi:hypothetical protein